MAMRTTPEDVRDVLDPGGDYKEGKPIQPFMTAANGIVNWIQSNAVAYGRTALSTTDARTLETWLAAWAYKCSDQQLSSHSAGASGSFRGATGGKGFEMNNYGSAAMVMDSTGMLRALNEGRIVGTAWLGTKVSDALTWNERN